MPAYWRFSWLPKGDVGTVIDVEIVKQQVFEDLACKIIVTDLLLHQYTNIYYNGLLVDRPTQYADDGLAVT
jgi:hypothetical protein